MTAFSSSFIPPYIADAEYEYLVKLLRLHYAYPLPYPLSGAYFEEPFATAIGGKREERKQLFDVLRARTGWSLKTLLWPNVSIGSAFEVVIQRCDILKDRNLTLDSPATALGVQILRRFNGSCEHSAEVQQVDDSRAGFLLRNAQERNFVFFQQRYRLYSQDEVEWRWANDERKSLMGYVTGTLVLRWYRSGTQLFGVYAIPEGAHEFTIEPRRASLEKTLAFFESQGIAPVRDRDSSL